jgi:hypothetical protein
VAAVQLSVEAGRVVAQARCNRTGDEAETIALSSPALVQIALVDRDVPPLPPIEPPALGDAGARVQVFSDGESAGEAILSRAALSDDPPRRGFGHVWCRWLREGGVEPGFDLTAFAASGEGGKFERIVTRPLVAGAVIGYAVAF